MVRRPSPCLMPGLEARVPKMHPTAQGACESPSNSAGHGHWKGGALGKELRLSGWRCFRCCAQGVAVAPTGQASGPTPQRL